ncbi:MAG: leucine-rich repeat protein [Spirochaetaceae bacterium]|nr:leucine-rich repeat protein [Spirochaetaceae bacterium]
MITWLHGKDWLLSVFGKIKFCKEDSKMKTQSKKLVLAAIALMALVTIALPLVGCKNDTTSFTEPVEYTVTFNTNGSTEVESQTVQSGATLSRPAGTPSREGYEFLGWYSEFDFTNPYDFNSPVTSNFILYANWKVEITPEEDDVIDKLTGDGLYTLVATGDWMNPQAIWTDLIAAGITAKINLDLRDVTALINIGNQAFSAWENLTDIKLPDSVTSIGKYAFSGCSRLTGIRIPDSVTTIEEFAFQNCSSLVSITIPNGCKLLKNEYSMTATV